MKEGARREVAWILGIVVVASALSWWFATHTRPMDDEGALLTAAARLLRGGVFYRDVLAYWFPGSAYLLALAMKLLGEDVAVARLLAGTAWLLTLVLLQVLAFSALAFRRAACFGLVLVAMKVFAWPAWTAFYYWDLAFAAACGALLAFLGAGGRPRPRLGVAGVCIGLAFVFKQNVGLYLGAASLLLLLLPTGWPRAHAPFQERLGGCLRLGIGIGVVVGPVLVFFAAQGLLGELLYMTFLHPLVGYLSTSGLPFWEPLAWWRLGSLRESYFYFPAPYYLLLWKDLLPAAPLHWLALEIGSRLLYTSVVVAAVGGAVLVARKARGLTARPEVDRRLLAFVVLGASVVFSAFPRADFAHVISVYPLVLLGLIQLWERWLASRPLGGARIVPALELGLTALFLVASGALSVAHQARSSHRMELPRAVLWVPPEHAYVETLVRHLSENVAPDEHFFVYGNEAYLYFLADRYFPWPYAQIYPGMEGGDGGETLARVLRQKPPALVIHGWTERDDLPPPRSYAPKLDRQVAAQFVPDPGFFERHPSPTGIAPEPWHLTVWRPRAR